MKLVKESLNEALNKEEFFRAAGSVPKGQTMDVEIIYGDHNSKDIFHVGNFEDGPFKTRHYYIFFGNKQKSMNIDKQGSTEEAMRCYSYTMFGTTVEDIIPWKNIKLL